MEFVKLNSNEMMPIVGTGTNTYGKENNEYHGELNGDFSALEDAIALGYRSIDAAVSYGNEAGVGQTVANSGINRDEFFITSKIPRDEEYFDTKDAVRETIEKSLKNFETDYLDLYLIHHPIENKEYFKHTWEVLEEYYKEGKLKSIGVSNHDESLLNEMKEFATVKPAVNQIQVNMREPNSDLINLLHNLDIVPVAWGPMKADDKHKEVLEKIGKRYNKTWGQVLLKYQLQRGVVVIPKSHNKKHQEANIDLFDFELSEDEMNQIKEIQ